MYVKTMECKCPLIEITIEQWMVQQCVIVLKFLDFSGCFPTSVWFRGGPGIYQPCLLRVRWLLDGHIMVKFTRNHQQQACNA